MASNQFDLAGQTALVTGGAGSIGAAICQAFIDSGAKVVVADIKDFGENKAAELNQAAGDTVAVGVSLDVTSAHSIQAAIDAGVEAFGSLDILVNCAGVNLKKPTLEITDEEERFVMEVNYFGPVTAAKLAAKQMIKQGRGGSIVNICSVTSFMALSEVTPYACSKSALLGLTRQLAVEWPRLYGIRVNAIAPGFVPAGQNRAILKSGDRGRRILEHTPMERFGKPEEIAGAVVFFCSPAGSFMNGACIKIDGGFQISGVSDAQPKDDA
jgi:NAD(P)-dependent dehydrogenase (short-subunit alcohol dehydrogenase family)